MPTTTGNGQIIMNSGDVKAVQPMPLQEVSGSIAQAAAAKTAADQAEHAAAFTALGAGQKGSGHRKTRKGRGRKLRGGAAVQPMNIPTAGSVPGQNPTDIAQKSVELRAQLAASRSYDSLANAQPREVTSADLKGGFRLRDAEDLYPGSGTQSDSKRKRKTKKKHGRGHRRTHRGKRRKHRTLRRRRHSRV
jgi:hypothetical protein